MEQNIFGQKVQEYRKAQSMTQEALATELGLTAQAVSKWENGQGYPDVALLPRLADLFGVSIDALFGRANQSFADAPSLELPWPDDRNTFRVVVFAGHTLVGSEEVKGLFGKKKVEFQYEGPAMNIVSELNVSCEAVQGNVTAKGSVSCDDVGGMVSAQGSISCDNVRGNVNAAGSVNADAIEGDVNAGGSVNCDDIGGNVKAGGNVICETIRGGLTQNPNGKWRGGFSGKFGDE